MNSVYAALGPTIFETMSGLAAETGAINLGQAFPEVDGPLDVREAAAQAVLDGPNQYPPMRGLPALREAVADHYAAQQGIKLDWKTEVTITSGATEALAAALLAVIEPGDEVVLFEPMYDSYLPMVRRSGGIAKIVRLAPPHWRIDEAQLAAAVSGKTKAIVICTPGNPSSNLFSAEDLALVARYASKSDAVVISDEVWEHVVFDGRTHESMLKHLRDRTIKIGSAGKMFSMTGWKVGFACAAPRLTELFAKAHQFLTFTTAPSLQKAVAYGLRKPAAHFAEVRAAFERGRDRLDCGLKQAGYATLSADGAYFLTVDLAASGIAANDLDFALRCVKDAKIAVIPYSAFYAKPDAPALVRLCFAKTDATLDQALERLVAARRLFV
ncbi:aminotransferase [Terricaulis sp.]|uniref:aminotransferase n=1 Tax=Terricaulis sp. TaxID=2768686 RepID=UPI003784C70B